MALQQQNALNAGESHDADPLDDLLARCALRDRAAFTALYKATSRKMLGIAMRILKNRDWAEEVLQQAFLKVWYQAEAYQAERGAPIVWLTAIVRNQALDVLRSAEYRRLQAHTSLDPDVIEDTPSPESRVSAHAELARVHRCLERLGEEQRRCLLLAYHEGYTPTEIAKKRRTSLDTVKTWLRRGVSRLRECLRT